MRFLAASLEKNATGSPGLSSDCLNTKNFTKWSSSMSSAFWFMIAVASTAFFTFISFIIWVESRRKEREAHYRDEMARKVAEAGDSGPVLELVRANARTDAEQVRLKARVAGLITFAAGAGLMIFLYALVPTAAVYLVGLIPLFIGVVLLILSEFMMKPRD
ncbi:MAG: hypothetical protein HKN13_12870 [Rhodothermales bacterium]|nr:hypothetical protein [Rhodothermales bacterium]